MLCQPGADTVKRLAGPCRHSHQTVSLQQDWKDWIAWHWGWLLSQAPPQLCSFFSFFVIYSAFCTMTKRAISYNMIDNNICTSGRLWKTLFHRRCLTVVRGARRRRRKQGSRASILVRLRKRASTTEYSSGYVQSLDNKLDKLRSRMVFQPNILRFVTLWFSSRLASTPRSRTLPLFLRGSPFTARTGQ